MSPDSAAGKVNHEKGDFDDGPGKRPACKPPVRDHLDEQAACQERQRQHGEHDQRPPVAASRRSGAGRRCQRSQNNARQSSGTIQP